MAILIKFIALPLYPLGMAILIQIAAIILLLLKKQKYGAILSCISISILLVFSSPIVQSLLCRSLESKAVENLPPPGTDATIIVLGGGGVPFVAPRVYPEINEAGDRMLHGARLYKSGVGKRVVTTGGDVGTSFHKAPSEAAENAMILQEIGVDSLSIIKEHFAKNTHEHPRYIASILDSMKVGRTVVIVTTASHMKRSVAVFKKFGGYTIYTAPTDYLASNHIFNRITDLFPSVNALQVSTVIIHEYYGIIGYKILGWI